MTTLSLIPEERRRHNMPQSGSISLDSIHSSTNSKFSANMLNRRKIGSVRQSNLIPMNSEFRQRVVSARVLRMKNLQNQLNDAYHQISELVSENRILRTLHKRQDSALSKYENTNAELPQLLSSHAEEIRVLQTKQKQLQIQNRELTGRLKKKDAILLAITDQNKHLIQLNKDKNLEEREKLSERVAELQQRLVEKDNEYKLLSRRLQLESKCFKSQMTTENHKIKELTLKLDKANLEVQRLTDLVETVERNNKILSSPYGRAFTNNAQIKSIRTKDQAKMNSNSTDPNFVQKSFSNSNLALPVFMEKASSSEIIENQSSSGKSYKIEKHEFSIRTKNINLPRADGDARRRNNHEPILETETKSKKSEISLLIKNGMKAALSAGSSSSVSTNDQYSDSYEEQNDAAEESHDEDYGSEARNNVQNHESSSSDYEKQDYPEDVNKSVIEVIDTKNKIVLNGHEDEEIKCLDKEIEKIQAEIKNELITNEDLLDTYCDDIIKTTSNSSNNNNIRKLSNSSLSSQATTANEVATPSKKPLRNVEINLKTKQNGSVGSSLGGNKKQIIDQKRKVKLLAALKAIDSNESFDS